MQAQTRSEARTRSCCYERRSGCRGGQMPQFGPYLHPGRPRKLALQCASRGQISRAGPPRALTPASGLTRTVNWCRLSAMRPAYDGRMWRAAACPQTRHAASGCERRNVNCGADCAPLRAPALGALVSRPRWPDACSPRFTRSPREGGVATTRHTDAPDAGGAALAAVGFPVGARKPRAATPAAGRRCAARAAVPAAALPRSARRSGGSARSPSRTHCDRCRRPRRTGVAEPGVHRSRLPTRNRRP